MGWFMSQGCTCVRGLEERFACGTAVSLVMGGWRGRAELQTLAPEESTHPRAPRLHPCGRVRTSPHAQAPACGRSGCWFASRGGRTEPSFSALRGADLGAWKQWEGSDTFREGDGGRWRPVCAHPAQRAGAAESAVRCGVRAGTGHWEAPADAPCFVRCRGDPCSDASLSPALFLCFREERTTARSSGGGATR